MGNGPHFLLFFIKFDRLGMRSLPLRVQSLSLGMPSLSPRRHRQAPSSAAFAASGAIPVPSGAIFPAKMACLVASIALLRDFGCIPCRCDCDPSPFGCRLSGKVGVPSRTFRVDLGRGEALCPMAFVPHRSSSGLLTAPCIAFTTCV